MRSEGGVVARADWEIGDPVGLRVHVGQIRKSLGPKLGQGSVSVGRGLLFIGSVHVRQA